MKNFLMVRTSQTVLVRDALQNRTLSEEKGDLKNLSLLKPSSLPFPSQLNTAHSFSLVGPVRKKGLDCKYF